MVCMLNKQNSYDRKLQTENLIVKQEPVIQQVKCAERSGAPLEILSTEQWFIRVMNSKSKFLKNQ